MQTSYVQYYETKTFAALPFQVGTSRNWLKKKQKVRSYVYDFTHSVDKDLINHAFYVCGLRVLFDCVHFLPFVCICIVEDITRFPHA